MDIITEIRRRHFVSTEKISSIARSLKLSRTTIRKHLKTEVEPVYQRQTQPSPKLGEYRELLRRKHSYPKSSGVQRGGYMMA
ncbi:hypothetical protein [uncultured Nitrosomonas sp.]|uniref:hypothetical protein n=1 Tax=uncultured Nitrosomonas sp. TaxID=156424 RepID=UPI0025F9663E|nr:hypothetical protein [uncultured Nitrosomonas sp.]